MVAASLGFFFDETTLQAIVAESHCLEKHNLNDDAENKVPQRITKALEKLERVGLIERASSNTQQGSPSKFSHDQVPQSALELVPRGREGVLWQRRVGQVLLAMSSSAVIQEWMLFSALDLCGRCVVRSLSKQGQGKCKDG